MKKSIYMFIGGSLFGVVAAITIVKYNSGPQQTEAVALQPTANPEAKIITAKMQEQMQKSGQPLESEADMQVRVQQEAAIKNMMGMQGNDQAEATMPAAESNKQALSQVAKPKKQSKVAAPVIPPTEEQVEQYQAINKVIRSAANNPKVNLSDLIKKADSLTIEQRNQLTKQTLGMLDRGELSIEQFANK